MISLARSTVLRRAAATSVAGMLAVSGAIASGGAASADTILHAKYPVSGSTFIAAPGATVDVGPGTLASKVDLTTDTLTADLKLPPATASFNELDLIPVTATTTFVNKGPTTGTLDPTTGAVSTTSHIVLKLSNVTVAGLPVSVGKSCKTSSPATITVNSDPGFSVVSGGNLSGTYTLPSFTGCGLLTPVLDLTLSGSGNTITLTLGAAQK